MRFHVFISVLAWVLSVATVALRSDAQPPAATTRDGVFSAEQADTGADLYHQICVKCHGPSLEGSDMVPALTGPKFATAWNGRSVGELYDRIRVAMPADMPASLENYQVLTAVIFILRTNGAPAGTMDLPNTPAILNRIRIADLK